MLPSSERSPLATGVSLGGLVLATFAVTSYGVSGPAAVALLAVAAAAWLAWLGSAHHLLPAALSPPAIGVMAAAGGALTGFASPGMIFSAVAAMALTIAQPFRRAVWVVVAAPAAMFVTTAVNSRPYGTAIGGLAAVLGASVLGVSRREALERTRAEAEAQLLAGRNHLARELHDVLAHTLSALSLQLEGLDALVSSQPERPAPAVREQMDRIKRLVREGIDEARGAVAALREDLPPLDERLAKLAVECQAGIEVNGPRRQLAPDVALALYRVAQEALTNVAKHAPGAPAGVRLDYSDKEVTLSVANPPSPAGPAASAGGGGGYGLQGIRERILLIGGQVDAGPADGGWRVEARVPA